MIEVNEKVYKQTSSKEKRKLVGWLTKGQKSTLKSHTKAIRQYSKGKRYNVELQNCLVYIRLENRAGVTITPSGRVFPGIINIEGETIEKAPGEGYRFE